MAKKRRKHRTPRVVLVDLRQIRDLQVEVEELRELFHQCRLLAEDLVSLKSKRRAAATTASKSRKAEPTRTTRPEAQPAIVVDDIVDMDYSLDPDECLWTTARVPVKDCECQHCAGARSRGYPENPNTPDGR